MTELDGLLILNAIHGIGPVRKRKLIEEFGGVHKGLDQSLRDIVRSGILPRTIAENLSRFPKDNFLKEEYALIRKNNVKIVTIDDPLYPQNLKEIPDAPFLLYIKGELSGEHHCAIAVVGSRRSSYYGLSMADKFSSQLAQRGITVVSGMARGIDSAAHKGAIKNNGQTLAVLGCGLGHIYPPENKDLFDQISDHGAVISEFPMSTLPKPGHFPRRNRIISGLCLGVLVIEAAQRSGALITTNFALEQGREVFALPGKIDHANAQGVNKLIKQGAKLVTDIEDVIEEIKPICPEFWDQENCVRPNKNREDQSENFSCDENRLIPFINDAPGHIDQIIEQSGVPVGFAMKVLLELEMKKKIKQLPGKMFVKVNTKEN